MLQIQSEEDYCEIVEEFSDMIYRIACQNLFQKADAEDVVQDVYVKLLGQRKGKFRDKEHLKAWLIRVALNQCRDYTRRSKRRDEVPMEEQTVIVETADSGLWEELARLGKDERTVLYLHYFEGYCIREIAGIVGMNQNTVSSKLVRARRKLRSWLEE